MISTVKIKKRTKKNIAHGIAHIYTTFNNSIITITDNSGATIAWATCGSKGFKGSKKNTTLAAQIATEEACRKAKEHGVKALEVYVKGPGSGRESSLRAISSCGIKITMIRDVTPVPHNGCRPVKQRRV